VYNIAYGSRTSLNELFDLLKRSVNSDLQASYGPARKGDVRHSLADISKATTLLDYKPPVNVQEGLKHTMEWYKKNLVV
jgi:UDP-N-acetylglucosamine 4-epimerase